MEGDSKLVGFVDREFREFELSDDIQDNLNEHKVINRLIWSRGHSVENYFFDFSVLRDPLRDLSATECFDRSLDLFENVLDATIRLACAASLTGQQIQRINLIKDVIHWELIEITSSQLKIDFDNLKNRLVQKNVPSSDVNQIVDSLKEWLGKIETTDFEIVRWLCHGHIGFSFIWAVYSRCVYESCKSATNAPATEVASMYGVKEKNRFQAIASWWARKAFGNQCIYPLEVLKLLDIPFP